MKALALLLVFCIGGLLLVAGCDQPPLATTAESQELILRFYTACNTQNLERLKVAQQKLQDLLAEGKVSVSEQTQFNHLVELAEQGRWEQAADNAYAFSQAQVR